MKTLFKLFFCAVLSLVYAGVFAQARYNVSGIVTNDKGEPIKSATVFIGGSERVMPTDGQGRFKFTDVPQGTFQLSVQMLGYEPLTRNILVQSVPINVEMKLATKEIRLAEVVIGRSNFDNNFLTFKTNFLGTSTNADQCVIVNPKALHFTTRRKLLFAEADEFLIIENKRLGYRLHYQLKDFMHDGAEGSTLFHGECSFEELPGTDEQKAAWARNRLETYQGSFMHFLRSVFQKNTLENGFITRPMLGFGTERINPDIEDPYKVYIKDKPVMFDSLLTPMGTGFMTFKFNRLYIVYDPLKAATYTGGKSDEVKMIIKANKSSMLQLGANEAIIDQKGSYTDYNDFSIRGNWAFKRVADQLPVEYQPPSSPISNRDATTDKLMASLQLWTDTIPQEKMYLHMDKPYYAINDTLWFKGYLTTGSRHQLSAISGAAYVDLIDEQNHPIKTLKLPVNSGTIAGNFVLGDDIKKGSYHIRAYTSWMRNAGPDYFFDHTFTVGNIDNKTAAPAIMQTDVQFFPESGSLVNGISSKVGFKAVSSDGLGTSISGKVTDNDNTEVAQINTLHAGMGNFTLKPAAGKTYTAKINFADGTTKSMALPNALNEGYVLSIFQPNKDSVLVRIQASATLQQSTVNLIVHSSGEIIFASPIKITGPSTSIWLDKRGFPSGIAQFTLFDSNSQPLNERIAFIKRDDALKVTIDSAQSVTKSRGHVQINLKVADSEKRAAESTLSVAVINLDKVPVDESAESTIFSNILLTSDLKGYIEKPNYYFTADTDEVNRALDNLMLTQGYRRFEWKAINTTINTKPTFKAEDISSSISGTVTTLTHKPMAKAKVKLFAVRAAVMKDTVTDENGRFKFDKMFIGDSLKFTLQARTPDNTDKAIITLDTAVAGAQISSQVTLRHNKNTADAAIIKARLQKAIDDGKPIDLSGMHVLKQVDIKANRIAAPKIEIRPQSIFTVPEGSVDKIITIPNPENYNNLTMFLRTAVQGVDIQVDQVGRKLLVDMRPANPPAGVAETLTKFDSAVALVPDEPLDQYLGKELGIIVDGRKISGRTEADEILEGSILAGDIAKIEVVRTNSALVSSLRGQNDRFIGFVLLFTKTGDWRKGYNPSIVNIIPKGFNKVRKFYSPVYKNPETAAAISDFRTTIYWNPYIGVDLSGKTSFDFYNADGPANYRVVVEGINAAGEIGRQVYNYRVE